MPGFAPFVFLLSVLQAAPAWARDYDIYRSDYFKGAFCSAIGGACAADNDLISGLFQNPAAMATGEPVWDFDGDYVSRDIVEQGVNGNSGAVDSSAVGGIGFSNGRWGTGLAFVWRRSAVSSPTTLVEDSGKTINTVLYGNAYSTQLRIPFGYHFESGESLGITISLNRQFQKLDLIDPTVAAQTQPSSTEVRFMLGGLMPLSEKIRLGTWFRTGVTLADYIAFTSNYTGFVSYKEVFSQHAPWIWAMGAAYEASHDWTLYAENDLIGTTPDGFLFTYTNFSASPPAGSLVAKGRSVVFEPHAGARHSFNEKLRVHFGSYYENSRWEKITGRLHGTGGVSYQFGKLLEVIAGADVARRYAQLFFTFR
ncbi:MAG: hypothetical protein ACXVB9_18030 [Bdellovibrionota bacterium]